MYSDKIESFFMHPLLENIVRKGLARIDNVELQDFILKTIEHLFLMCRENSRVLLELLNLLLERILPDVVTQSLKRGEDFHISERTKLFFKLTSTIILKSQAILDHTTKSNTLLLKQQP